MQQVTIGARYQIVIPKEVRNKMKHLKPGNKVNIGITGKDTLIIHADPKNWVKESLGIAKEAWKNIDPIAELDKMRDEWDRKP